MKHRSLHIAAYDICCPRRLREGLDVLKNFSTGGQRSVFECFLSEGERRRLVAEIGAVLEPAEDRFLLVRLDPRSPVITLGIAVPPADPPFFYVE